MDITNKKTVLLFIDWFLPGTASGGPVRSLVNMMNHMEDYLNFKVITRDTDYVSVDQYDNVKSDEWNKLFQNVDVFYLSKKNQNLSTFRFIINNTDFDVVYINGIYSPIFSILPIYALKNSQKKIIVGARGMLNPQAFSVKGSKKKLFLSFVRFMNFYKSVIFHATNEDEKMHITDRLGKNYEILVAPNFPRKNISSIEQFTLKNGGGAKFVNIARISPEKGTLFMLNLFSEITVGEITLDLFGSIYDEDYWEKCKEVISTMPDNIIINYRGAVDGDLIPELIRGYHFFIMPSKGENFGHSIVEAFMAGLPVLISDKTPWKNLEDKKVGWDMSLKDAELFRERLEQCVQMNSSEYERLSLNAYKYGTAIMNDPGVMLANKKLFFG